MQGAVLILHGTTVDWFLPPVEVSQLVIQNFSELSGSLRFFYHDVCEVI